MHNLEIDVITITEDTSGFTLVSQEQGLEAIMGTDSPNCTDEGWTKNRIYFSLLFLIGPVLMSLSE